jgi:PAS domain-containing protein
MVVNSLLLVAVAECKGAVRKWPLCPTTLSEVIVETTGSDELLAWIMDSTTDGLWVFDDHGTTTFANPRMAQMLGRAPEEMPGFAVADALDVDGRA